MQNFLKSIKCMPFYKKYNFYNINVHCVSTASSKWYLLHWAKIQENNNKGAESNKRSQRAKFFKK